MELSQLSYKLHDDDQLTTVFSGLLQLVHQTDLSDNPRDFVKYFGSNESSRILRAASNPGVDNIVISAAEILPVWAAETVYEVGDTRRPTVENTFRYRVKSRVGAFESGTTEPTWPTGGVGSTVVDGDITWELVAAAHQDSEITLALSAEDLETNTPGADLSLGTSISSGIANAIAIHIRITNAVTTVSNNTGEPELAVNINSVTESAV